MTRYSKRSTWTRVAILLVCAWAGSATSLAKAAPRGEEPAPAADDAALARRLEAGGFTPERARGVVQSLADARRAGLPVDSLVSRLDEGLAKQASSEDMERALRSRLRALESAARLLADTGYGDVAAEPRRQLLGAVALALESGVAADDVREVVARGQGRFALRMASVVEAGESLHLVGIGRACVKTLMSDFLSRNLGRMEVLRAVKYCIQQHHAGASDDAIRSSLWGPPGSSLNI